MLQSFNIIVSQSKFITNQVRPIAQVVTVGIVGGSDLIKVMEQLGKSGIQFTSSLLVPSVLLANQLIA